MASEDRRVEKTKKIIDDACWELMQEKSFDEITVRDIASRAKINRATFYRYHVDKYDWMEKKIRELMSELTQISSDIKVTTDKQELTSSIEAMFLHLDAHFFSYSNLINNKGTIVFQDLFKGLLLDICYETHGIQANQIPQMDLRFHLEASAAAGAIEWWIKNNRPLSAKQMAQELSGMRSNNTDRHC